MQNGDATILNNQSLQHFSASNIRAKQFKCQYDLAIIKNGIEVAGMIYYSRAHKMFQIFMADIEWNQYNIALLDIISYRYRMFSVE